MRRRPIRADRAGGTSSACSGTNADGTFVGSQVLVARDAARAEDTRFRISGPRAPVGGTPGSSAPSNAREPAAPEVPPAHVLKLFSHWMDYWSGLRSALAEPSTLKMPHRPWLTWFSRPPSR